MKLNVVYVPMGVGTFHKESADAAFTGSLELLKQETNKVAERVQQGGYAVEVSLYAPESQLLSVQEVSAFLQDKAPDLLVLENITFANAAYTEEVVRQFPECPVLLWTVPEPVVDGTRLRLNSLTGAYSAGYTMRSLRQAEFSYVYGSYNSEAVGQEIRTVLLAAALRKFLREVSIAAIGHTPEGFGFGRALDTDLLRTFGVRLKSLEVRELIDRAKQVPEETAREVLTGLLPQLPGMEKIPVKNQLDFARLLAAYRRYVQESGIKALSSRCWPDLFVDYGTPVCLVLSLLNSEGTPASCEADTYGALTMLMARFLTGKSCFFGDPVSVDEGENTLTFWHCGMAPADLARQDTGAAVGVHPNRKIGPTAEFGCREFPEATILRVGRKMDPKTGETDFRILTSRGKILDRPRQFYGTSVVVEMETDVEKFVKDTVTSGWEPHFVVAYGDVMKEILAFGRMLGIPVVEY